LYCFLLWKDHTDRREKLRT